MKNKSHFFELSSIAISKNPLSEKYFFQLFSGPLDGSYFSNGREYDSFEDALSALHKFFSSCNINIKF